ncbi:hypothetical protein [Atlantibacter sp. RC6]|uniref:hypothetical protein n=1 Tax=Atlantibacter sp. RC6 TaxID=2587036 RepID=UPI00184EEE4B|nr:hypothetical protein [Atlantibacter sp. RC6]MBB3324905.1 hypothetical protein [Atlantibacter sp. RC6]
MSGINERVSNERLVKPEIRDSKYWNGLEFKCDLYHADMQDFYTYANMLTGADHLELQQYRAAADKPVAVVDIQSGRKDGNKFAVVFTREGQALPDDIYYLHAAPQVTSVPEIGEIRVGLLPTMNQDEYPGLGDWWVQLRIGEDYDEVLARVYGATPQEANNRAEALACRAAMLAAPVVQEEQEVKK